MEINDLEGNYFIDNQHGERLFLGIRCYENKEGCKIHFNKHQRKTPPFVTEFVLEGKVELEKDEEKNTYVLIVINPKAVNFPEDLEPIEVWDVTKESLTIKFNGEAIILRRTK